MFLLVWFAAREMLGLENVLAACLETRHIGLSEESVAVAEWSKSNGRIGRVLEAVSLFDLAEQSRRMVKVVVANVSEAVIEPLESEVAAFDVE